MKDPVHMKNFIYFATIWHYREVSGNVNCNFIYFSISLYRNIRNTNLNFANISLKLWEKQEP